MSRVGGEFVVAVRTKSVCQKSRSNHFFEFELEFYGPINTVKKL